MIRILLKESVEKITPQQAKQILINDIKFYGLEYAPNISPEFALTVAFRESSFDPYVIKGTKLGIFQVGKDAADDVKETKNYPKAAQDIHIGIRIGLKYLQYQYEFVKQEYPSSKYNLYALTYIAYNLGRANMIKVVQISEGRAEPDKNVISAIQGQTEAFVGENDKETVANYYNNVNKAFAKFK